MSVEDRQFTLTTAGHVATFNLQNWKLVWLTTAAPDVAAGSSRLAVRLVLANGQGLDMTEPAKTKRTKVTTSTWP